HVNSYPRDRVRGLQLMQQALPLLKDETDKAAVAEFYLHFAQQLLAEGNQQAWRLQALTDLGQLPDYEDGDFFDGGAERGAPVDAKGKPVFHHLPKSFETASSDGERWRWMLNRAAETDPSRVNEIDMRFANFLISQFGEQTVAQRGWYLPEETKGKDGS